MLKKGLVLFLILAMLVSVTACGAGGDKTADDTKSTTTTGSAVQEDSSSDNSDESNEDDDRVEDVPGQGNGTPVDTLPQEQINEAMFIAGSPDGYAVVYYEDVYYCVNGRGEITGRLTDCYPYALARRLRAGGHRGRRSGCGGFYR